MGAQERRDRTTDAIVVLGCRVESDGTPSKAAARRCEAAAEAFSAGLSPVVVASGGRRWGRWVEAIQLRARLVHLGVPDESILVELCSLTTAENALYSAALVREHASTAKPTVAIATCAWHQARAKANFEQVGLSVLSLPTHEPQATWLERFQRATHEALSARLDRATLERAGHRGSDYLPESLVARARSSEGVS